MCTRIFWNDNQLAAVVGRTMDWPESTEPVLTVFPRGAERHGGMVGHQVAVAENPLTWASTYASLVTTIYGVGTADGLNERGLGAHLLFLTATDFGPRDAQKPGLHAGLWAQYLLDSAATVSEALGLLEDVQIVMAEARGTRATVHLALEDAGGDSAIVEYIGGERVVHHGSEFRVMTNDPPYDQQLALLQGLDFSHPSSDTPLPGNVAPDRPLRAGQLLRGAAAGAQERAGGGGRRARDRAQRLGPLRGALQGLRHLQHRVPHGVGPHPRPLLLRAHDRPQRGVGRPRPVRPRTGRAGHGRSTPMTSRSRATSRRGSPRRHGPRSDGVTAWGDWRYSPAQGASASGASQGQRQRSPGARTYCRQT